MLYRWTTQPTEASIETRWTHARNVLVSTQVRRQCHTKNKNMDLVVRHDSFCCEPQGRTGTVAHTVMPQIYFSLHVRTSTMSIRSHVELHVHT